MTDRISDNLARLGVTLPDVAAPAANYVPYVITNSIVFTSGQLPFVEGKLHSTGKVGKDLSVMQAQEAARYCALNVLAVINLALNGDLERIQKLVKITGFVASDPSFSEQHLVVNGASDFLVDVLGERGKHSRSAVGNAALPFNVPVEIEAIFSIR